MLEAYATFKRSLSELTGATEDLLHVHFGLLIFVFFALILRRRMRSRRPLAAVYLFAIGNEVIDYINHNPWVVSSGLLDILNTVFWPTVLFTLARRGTDLGERIDDIGEAAEESEMASEARSNAGC